MRLHFREHFIGLKDYLVHLDNDLKEYNKEWEPWLYNEEPLFRAAII